MFRPFISMLIFAASHFFVAESFGAATKTLTMTTVKNANIQNISVLVLREAYSRIGYQLDVTKNPGLRSLIASNAGEFDGEISRVYKTNTSYKNLVRVDVPINVITGVAFVRKDFKFKPKNGWESLRGKTIGLHRGTVFSLNGTKGFPNLSIVNTHRSAFLMLHERRVDIVVCPLILGTDLTKALGLDGIVPTTPALGKFKLYHFLHKRNKHLVAPLEKVLLRMEAEGSIGKIRREFLRHLEIKNRN